MEDWCGKNINIEHILRCISVNNGVVSLPFVIIQCKFMKWKRHYKFVMSFDYILKGVFIWVGIHKYCITVSPSFPSKYIFLVRRADAFSVKLITLDVAISSVLLSRVSYLFPELSRYVLLRNIIKSFLMLNVVRNTSRFGKPPLVLLWFILDSSQTTVSSLALRLFK